MPCQLRHHRVTGRLAELGPPGAPGVPGPGVDVVRRYRRRVRWLSLECLAPGVLNHAARMSRIREVTILRCTGCSNSRCMPRPTNLILSIEPPQVEPWTC